MLGRESPSPQFLPRVPHAGPGAAVEFVPQRPDVPLRGTRLRSQRPGGMAPGDPADGPSPIVAPLGSWRFQNTPGRAPRLQLPGVCLLYTSDAADDLLCVDLG